MFILPWSKKKSCTYFPKYAVLICEHRNIVHNLDDWGGMALQCK